MTATIGLDSKSDIQKLNDQVNEIVKVEVQKNGEMDVDVAAVLNDKRVVYKDRHTWIPAFIILGCLSMNVYEVYSGNYIFFIISTVIMFLWYDFLSGILHIVLDNPEFINLPGIDDSCLEFQWHHRIPTDIISKSFLQVCGDLNVVILLILAFCFLPKSVYCCEYRSSLPVLLTVNKVLMAYFGQYCHQQSHTPAHRRPAAVSWLQDHGLMISSKEHLKHHHNYDCNFCIGSGMCNPILRFVLANVVSNKYVLLAFFLVSLFLDVPFFLLALKAANIAA